MYGYPKTINTRHDVEYLVGYLGTHWATEENILRGLGYLRGLRDSTEVYVFDRDLADDESPDGLEPLYRVMEDEDGRSQYLLQHNPTAPIYQLGFTVAEIENLIAIVEGGR